MEVGFMGVLNDRGGCSEAVWVNINWHINDLRGEIPLNI